MRAAARHQPGSLAGSAAYPAPMCRLPDSRHNDGDVVDSKPPPGERQDLPAAAGRRRGRVVQHGLHSGWSMYLGMRKGVSMIVISAGEGVSGIV
jgi:hypothetical protein